MALEDTLQPEKVSQLYDRYDEFLADSEALLRSVKTTIVNPEVKNNLLNSLIIQTRANKLLRSLNLFTASLREQQDSWPHSDQVYDKIRLFLDSRGKSLGTFNRIKQVFSLERQFENLLLKKELTPEVVKSLITHVFSKMKVIQTSIDIVEKPPDVKIDRIESALSDVKAIMMILLPEEKSNEPIKR